MAASDQYYRSQKTLDIVFAATSTFLLVSIIALFIQDYFRSWKPEQRNFRPVESGINLREAFADIPSKEKFDEARDQVDQARQERAANKPKIDSLNRELALIAPKKLKKEQAAADVKSLVESRRSFFDIAVDQEGINSANAKKWKAELTKYQEQFATAQAEAEEITATFKEKQRERDALEKGVTQALSKLKTLNDDLIRRVRVAEKKQWGWSDWVRALPVIDGFASPLKIHQFTINELPIDYNFKYVTRFDRCMTCHQGIDRPGFARDRVAGVQHLGPADAKWDHSMARIKSILGRAKYYNEDDLLVDNRRDFRKHVNASGIRQGKMVPVAISVSPTLNNEFSEALENLRDLIHNGDPDNKYATKQRLLDELDAEIKLVETQALLRELREEFKGTPEAANLPDPDAMKITRLGSNVLSDSRVIEYSAHPRLDLFVGSNSKHSSEKFGCTICHGGQPSGTDFSFSSHTPNSSPEKDRWVHQHDWKSIHDWEFPMLPKRFMEASCVQCHHQMTDLISSENRNEAPKLLQGYNLVRENGCFGCHEIHGQKGGRSIGPDMRLEPTPPLELLSPADREKAINDQDNPPGSLRKVGPSLYRLPEKTHKDFVSRWIKAPREFRPDTRMPHYYGLSNNNEAALKGTGQEKFPDAEVASITHFLFVESQKYLDAVKVAHQADPEKRKADETRFVELTDTFNNKVKLATIPADQREKMKQELTAVKLRIDLRAVPGPLDFTAANNGDKEERNLFNGRKLFTEKGCLACHTHHATSKAEGKPSDEKFLPPINSDAHFGPDLSQVSGKLLPEKADARAKARAQTWLTQWLKDPWVHSPRSKMPITQLKEAEAQDIAAWLLSQPATELGEDWNKVSVDSPDQETLKNLARVYLERILSKSDLEAFFKGELPAGRVKEMPVDEQALVERLSGGKDARDGYQWYLGKKAVSRLGCFGCHSIPGYDTAKPIGVGLNDWGKKDAHRLAFEDINAYVKDNYHVVPKMTDDKGNPVQFKDNKAPYEQFYADALVHNSREGYLHQKVKEPRSYDYLRDRAWDDRSRMPQFKFAKVAKKETESKEDFLARANLEEQKSRESVMTFVLGLIAEPIPLQYVNAPKAERLAEVKGKQVLDKFNCAGCHTIRPGFYDFKFTDKTLALLETRHTKFLESPGAQGDYNFTNHSSWFGPLPIAGPGGKRPEKLQAQGEVQGFLTVQDPERLKDKKAKLQAINLRLSTDLRFPGSKGAMLHIPAGDSIPVLPEDFTQPPLKAMLDQARPPRTDDPEHDAEILKHNFLQAIKAREKSLDVAGGTFGDLLVEYLQHYANRPNAPAEMKAKYNPSDDSNFRIMVPPLLLREGERTRPEWLAEWLRNPTQVRQMTFMRMPKFNMSQDEAQALVAYFGGVDRQQNPGIGLTFPFVGVPQKADFTDPYWLNRTKEYVARLKETKDPDEIKEHFDKLKVAKEKELGKKDLSEAELKELTKVAEAKTTKKQYERRVEQLKPLWEKQQTAQVEDLTARIKATKDEAQKKILEADLKKVKDGGVKTLQEEWESQQAYFSDAFLLTKSVCTQCHQIGDKAPDPKGTVGPNLTLAWARLRPDWTERWVAHPQRFLTYNSVMPVNFPSNVKDNWAQYFAGEPLDRVIAVRDLLMIYPRVADLPISRHWLHMETQGEKK